MCGIAGIAEATASEALSERRLAAMCRTLHHRGPDEGGADIRHGVALGMRRLAIIDLTGGRQPVFNEDRTVRAVFNGEIYNYRELRAELESRGHRFASRSDSEVIVHLWEEEGERFVERLNGMFAIALHDAGRGKFLLARDHLGIKPLFYALDDRNRRLVFGSEVKAVLASGLVERRLDADQLRQFLAWEYVPGAGTLLQDVRKLPPACTLTLDLNTWQHCIREYWDVPAVTGNGHGVSGRVPGDSDPRAWVEALDAKIAECVQRQLVSDVRLGAFLSGGIDSSLVVSSMGADARSFSIGFDDPTYNELPWARRVAEHLGVSHETEIVRPSAAELFEPLMEQMDDPIADFSIFPTYLVSQHARRHVTVALSGDGGDELFGGYETYLAQIAAGTWRRIPAPLRRGVVEPIVRRLRPTAKKKGLINKAKRFLEGLDHPEPLGHARWRLFAGDAVQSALLTPEAQREAETPIDQHVRDLSERARHLDPIDRALYVDLKSYLPDNCLVKMDRMSMAVSLEARVPMLDRELVELAYSMPSRFKVDSGETKHLLKRVACRRIPRRCVYRPKEGFSIPMKHWLKGEVRPIMEDLLDRRRIASEGVFRPETVERLKREHLDNRANHSHILWSLIVFQAWRRRWGA